MKLAADDAAGRGVQVVPHSWSSALNTAAALHVLATCPTAPTFELKPHPSPLQHELVAEPFDPVDGTVHVPDRPGLGCDVDEAVVERYTLRALTASASADAVHVGQRPRARRPGPGRSRPARRRRRRPPRAAAAGRARGAARGGRRARTPRATRAPSAASSRSAKCSVRPVSATASTTTTGRPAIVDGRRARHRAPRRGCASNGRDRDGVEVVAHRQAARERRGERAARREQRQQDEVAVGVVARQGRRTRPARGCAMAAASSSAGAWPTTPGAETRHAATSSAMPWRRARRSMSRRTKSFTRTPG